MEWNGTELGRGEGVDEIIKRVGGLESLRGEGKI